MTATGERIVDCHVHLRDVASADRIVEIADIVGLDRINVVCTIDRRRVNANPAALLCKARHPERVYAFCGLDHSSRLSGGELMTPSLAEQVDRLIALGADGMKMIEGKPTTRKFLDVPVDSPYFEDYFERLEQRRLPVLWHVNDPEEFWDPERTPDWAKERGWGYDETDVQKEDQYAEVERVLERHPGLVVIFAHFYFLSADLPRAARLLERFGGVHLDLAPGIEMLYNMSGDVARPREFFIQHADRIVFGTDISSGHTDAQTVARAGIVRRWLESADEYSVPPEVDFLLGKPQDGVMRGLSLPQEVLDKMYWTNFERIAGASPKALDVRRAAEECRRIAAIADDPSQAVSAAEALGALY